MRTRTKRAIAAASAVVVLGGTAAIVYVTSPSRAVGTGPVAIVGRTVVTQHVLSVARRQAPGSSRSELVEDVVREAVVVDEARRLHMLGGLTLADVVGHPDEVALLNTLLYDRAADRLGPPKSASVRRYARAVVREDDTDADLPGFPIAVANAYDAWLADRDRVASRWFSQLYARYRALTVYLPKSARGVSGSSTSRSRRSSSPPPERTASRTTSGGG